jgi:non-canonical poly(A) RNA polymerase PAPD5/7
VAQHVHQNPFTFSSNPKHLSPRTATAQSLAKSSFHWRGFLGPHAADEAEGAGEGGEAARTSSPLPDPQEFDPFAGGVDVGAAEAAAAEKYKQEVAKGVAARLRVLKRSAAWAGCGVSRKSGARSGTTKSQRRPAAAAAAAEKAASEKAAAGKAAAEKAPASAESGGAEAAADGAGGGAGDGAKEGGATAVSAAASKGDAASSSASSAPAAATGPTDAPAEQGTDDHLLSLYKSLTEDIEDFAAHTRYEVTLEKQRITLEIARLKVIVRGLWRHAGVESFGSYATGLWLPSSDVDLVVVDAGPVGRLGDSVAYLSCLQLLTVALNQEQVEGNSLDGKGGKGGGNQAGEGCGDGGKGGGGGGCWLESVTVLESARIPVIKIVTAGGTPIDLTIESPVTTCGSSPFRWKNAITAAMRPVPVRFTTTSPHCGLIVRDLFISVLAVLPELRPLVLVLRQFLREHGLNDAYHGGVSSHTLMLLALHFVQLIRSSGTKKAKRFAAKGNMSNAAPEEEDSSDDGEDGEGSAGGKGAQKAASAAKKKKKDAAAAQGAAAAAAQKKAALASDIASDTLMDVATALQHIGGGDSELRNRFGDDAAATVAQSLLKKCVEERRAERVHKDTKKGGEWLSQFEHPEGYLGMLLYRFLHFFGSTFDFSNTGISVHGGGFLFRLPKRNNHFASTDKLVVDDPVFPGHNVAGPTYRLELVLDTFVDACSALRRFRPTEFHPTPLCCLLSPAGHGADGLGGAKAAAGKGRDTRAKSRKTKLKSKSPTKLAS